MSKPVLKEQQRQYVERLLESDLSVPEWCRRNGITKGTMYRWLTEFAESEPELFGGGQNIVDRSRRRWVETTRSNITASIALATTKAPPATDKVTAGQTPGVIIVDTLFNEPNAVPVPQERIPATTASGICVSLNGASISIPPGCSPSDASTVLKAVARL